MPVTVRRVCFNEVDEWMNAYFTDLCLGGATSLVQSLTEVVQLVLQLLHLLLSL